MFCDKSRPISKLKRINSSFRKLRVIAILAFVILLIIAYKISVYPITGLLSCASLKLQILKQIHTTLVIVIKTLRDKVSIIVNNRIFTAT